MSLTSIQNFVFGNNKLFFSLPLLSAPPTYCPRKPWPNPPKPQQASNRRKGAGLSRRPPKQRPPMMLGAKRVVRNEGARKSKVLESLVDSESERGGSEDDDGSGGEDDVQVECVFALHTHVPTDVFQPVGRSRNSPGPS
jgi:hypothetical protein